MEGYKRNYWVIQSLICQSVKGLCTKDDDDNSDDDDGDDDGDDGDDGVDDDDYDYDYHSGENYEDENDDDDVTSRCINHGLHTFPFTPSLGYHSLSYNVMEMYNADGDIQIVMEM